MKKKLSFLLAIASIFHLCTACSESKEEIIIEEKDVAEMIAEENIQYANPEEVHYYQELFELLKQNENENLSLPFAVKHEVELWSGGGSDEPLSTLHASGKARSFIDSSIGYPFMAISAGMKGNPFANFNTLKEQGWVQEDLHYNENYEQIIHESAVEFEFINGSFRDCGAYMEYNQASPEMKFETFEYSQSGCKAFVERICALEGMNVNVKPMISPFLDEVQVFYSQEEDCYYTYLMEYDTSYGFITALYFRSADHHVIDEVTAQVMLVSFPCGDASAGVSLSIAGQSAYHRMGVFCLVMGIQQTLGGRCLYPLEMEVSGAQPKMLIVPKQYETEKYRMGLDYEQYTFGAETGEEYFVDELFKLYTYSIKMK